MASILVVDAEPVQRKRAQQGALTAIARIEKGLDPDEADDRPRPRLTRLERLRSPAGDVVDEARLRVDAGELTETQTEVLRAVADAASVVNAAAALGVSRANVYASLRRSARALGIESVPEVLEMLRGGTLVIEDD